MFLHDFLGVAVDESVIFAGWLNGNRGFFLEAI
jgi:hypothetical protein